MTSLPELASAITEAVRQGTVSAREITEAALARIAEKDPHIGAFTQVTRERAFRAAEAIDKSRKEKGDLGPLAGVPFGVKNLYDIEGLTDAGGVENQPRRIRRPKRTRCWSSA